MREKIARQSHSNFYVDKLVMSECWAEIHPWLNNIKLSSLTPYLIRDGLVNDDEAYTLHSHYETPGAKTQLVFNNVLRLGDYTCHLLYMAMYYITARNLWLIQSRL